MINQMMKSLIDQEKTPILLCDLNCCVIYANPASVSLYKSDLTGKNIKDCHNTSSNEKIERMIAWLKERPDNNILFMYHNPKANQDVYMVALRDENKTLIGFYEKHENRTLEASNASAL